MARSWATMEEFEAFLDDGGLVEVDDDMPDPYRQAVFSFIEMHANSELMGGLTERDWIPKTPGLRHKMAVLAKTQDEIGHSHLLYMIAADFGVKTRTEMIEDLFAGRSRFHNVFHYRAVTWGDQVAIAFLVDAAALISQQAVFKYCSYGPYRRILRRIIAEEGFHMRLGEDRMMRIAEGTARQRKMFQEALDRWFWPALQLFGPDSMPDDVLLRWRIKSERNEVLRDRWVQKFVPMLQNYGFTVPAPDLRWDVQAQRWDVGPDRLGAAGAHAGAGRPRLGPPDPRGRRQLESHRLGASRDGQRRREQFHERQRVLTMRVYEVFVKRDGRDEFRHVGALEAATDELALVLAREAYLRRAEGDRLWVVRRDHVVAAADDFVEPNADKPHRHHDGAAVAARRKAARQSSR